MTRLLKYLKPYLLQIIFIIILLFIQANADLALPDYLSKIVNFGIQQGGVENAVPQAIRQSEMARLFIFMKPDDKNVVLANYTLVDQNSPSYESVLEAYPAMGKQPIYLLNDIDQSVIELLNPIMGKPFLIVSSLETLMADPDQAAGLSEKMGFDLTQIPADTDVFALLASMPALQREQLSTAIDAQFASLGESLTTQMAVVSVKAEYEALGMDTGELQTGYITRTGVFMLLVSLAAVICMILIGYLSAKIGSGLARDLRTLVFQRVESLSSTEFDRFSTASLITRTTNDITQIQMVVIMMLRMVIYAPIIGVGGVIRALSKTASMWWLIALAVVVLLGLIMTVFSIALPKFKAIQGLIDRLNLVTRENLSGMMVIRAFNMQPFEEQRFDKANRDLTATMLFISRIMVIVMPLMMFIMNGLSLAIIWVGAHEIAQSRMQVGDMMAFMQYAMQILTAFLMLAMMFIALPRAAVSGDRIADVLETEPVIKDPQHPLDFPEPFKGTVEFRDVCFRYPGAEEDVLHEISFKALPGQTTAFIGTTGSGKSTIVNLIPRFYEVSDGEILVDNVDIRKVTQKDLRDRIGYVPQKSNLFSGTIESNLRYADEQASDETLKNATDIAQASEFIAEKPEGLLTEIAQGGVNISGGQKQRLAIARALVKQAPIYIFDDSFSALDFKTDSALRKALKEHASNSTLFIVTQRIATIKNANQIIVLDEGRIAGKGSHHELMKSCAVYREIALSQLSQEELA
ncbi:MAG: ABC transporter ATP-binding protein [Anaerolineaceae bacterium]|nr:ABC transporter ATP-binding protein [Anaerolineaceae bacterium]